MDQLERQMPKTERLIWLDSLRGFALLGILLMNIQTFLSAKYYYGGENELYSSTMLDHVTEWFLDLFVVGKFYPIFSMIFGISFVLFLDSLEKKGEKAAVFNKRLFFLALFGIVHMIFIWRGDILLSYALAGFFLMFFRKRSLIFIRRFAINLFIIANTFFALLTMVAEFVLLLDSESGSSEQMLLIEKANHIYQNASYQDMLLFRINEELLVTVINSVFAIFIVIPLFLIGYYITKKINIHHLNEHLDWLKHIWKKSLVLSTIFSTLFVLAKSGVLTANPVIEAGLVEWFRPFAGLAVAIFYMSSFVLLFSQNKWMRKLRFFRYTGRMALTNYILQSVICGFIFYGYGLGLYGYIGSALSLVIALIIYIGLSILTIYWLKIFHYGPLEWVWRTVTFNKKQVMRK